MNLYIPLALMSILLAFLSRTNRKMVSISFAVIMLASMALAAIRYEFGPDYFQYRIMYDQLGENGVDGYLSKNEHIESLFLHFLHLFPSYFLFIAVQSILWFGSVYYFLKSRLDNYYLWIVVFLLFFDVNNILNNYIAIRSSFVGILFLIALPYLKKNKLIYLLLMGIAFLIHNSSAPLALLVFFNCRKNQSTKAYEWLYVVTVAVGIVAFLFGDLISGPMTEYLINVFPQVFGKYSYYMENVFTERSISVGNLVFLSLRVYVVLLLITGLRKENDNEYIIFYKIAILMSLLSILFGNMLMSRFNMNLAPLMIVVYVRTMRYLKDLSSIVFVVSLMITALFTFNSVIHADYATSFLEYNSIIGHTH